MSLVLKDIVPGITPFPSPDAMPVACVQVSGDYAQDRLVRKIVSNICSSEVADKLRLESVDEECTIYMVYFPTKYQAWLFLLEKVFQPSRIPSQLIVHAVVPANYDKNCSPENATPSQWALRNSLVTCSGKDEVMILEETGEMDKNGVRQVLSMLVGDRAFKDKYISVTPIFTEAGVNTGIILVGLGDHNRTLAAIKLFNRITKCKARCVLTSDWW